MKRLLMLTCALLVAISAHSQYIINTTALRLLNGSASIAGTIPGTIYYDPLTDKFMFREGNVWVMLGSGSGGGITNGDKGDITISNLGATMLIDNNAITFAKFQTVSTNVLLGRISAATGLVEQLTPAQVASMLPTFTTTAKGLVPVPPNNDGTLYLSNAGTWTTPPGLGGTGSGTTETASNGLNKVGNDIRLGGALTQNTSITTSNAHQFRIVDLAADDYMFGINGFGRGGWNIGYGQLNGTTGQQAVMNIDPVGIHFRAQNSSGVGNSFSFRNDFVTFTDGRATKRGIEYAGPGYETQPYSLTTKNYVDQLVASVSNIAQFTSSTSGVVPPSGSNPSTKILYGDGIWRIAPSSGGTYNVFTRSVNGLVPAPGGSTNTRALFEDGTWKNVPTYSNFTASTSGLVSAPGTSNGSKVLYDDNVWRVPTVTTDDDISLAGSYTPTFVTRTNVPATSDPGTHTYIKVNNMWFISGSVSVDPTVANQTTHFVITNPPGVSGFSMIQGICVFTGPIDVEWEGNNGIATVGRHYTNQISVSYNQAPFGNHTVKYMIMAIEL